MVSSRSGRGFTDLILYAYKAAIQIGNIIQIVNIIIANTELNRSEIVKELSKRKSVSPIIDIKIKTR
jgi:hypothetical protein